MQKSFLESHASGWEKLVLKYESKVTKNAFHFAAKNGYSSILDCMCKTGWDDINQKKDGNICLVSVWIEHFFETFWELNGKSHEHIGLPLSNILLPRDIVVVYSEEQLLHNNEQLLVVQDNNIQQQ